MTGADIIDALQSVTPIELWDLFGSMMAYPIANNEYGLLEVTASGVEIRPVVNPGGTANRVAMWDATGDFVPAQFDAAIVALSTGQTDITITSFGEKDIATTSATKALILSPTGGNMTIDQVTGLTLGRVIPGYMLQDTTNRTVGLAGTTNAAAEAGALTMPTGSGAIGAFVLEGMLGAGGTVVPTFRKRVLA
jgi:hypothetical protein